MNFKKYFFIFFLIAGLINCRNSNHLALEGIQNLQNGKKITALKFFEEALDANKKNPIAQYGKGKIMLESTVTLGLGQKLIETSLEKLDDEYKSDAYISLASSYAQTNLYDRAIEILEKAIDSGVSSPKMFENLGFYYTQVLNNKKARSIYLKGIETYPQNISLVISLSNFYIKQFNNYSLAIESLESATKNIKSNQELILKLAGLHYKVGNKDKCIGYLNQLKNLQDNDKEKAETDNWIKQVQNGKWQS